MRDRGFRIIAILIPLAITIYTNDLFPNPDWVTAGRVLVSFVSILLICEGSRFLVYRGMHWFPRYRVLLTFLAGLGLTTTVLALAIVARRYILTGAWDASVMSGTHIFVNNKKLFIGLLGNCLLNSLFIFPLLFGAYEFIYHSAQLRFTKKEKEKLEQEKLKAELQQLKGIVNPHFLFNNLNSLSSLMMEDIQQAQDFLDELTKVFRYLLRNNETDLTTLEQELRFIQSYYHLLQTRYGNGISMNIQIDNDHLALLVPPLTLQLLVENAAKHNQLSKENPLKIELLSDGSNKLVIKNNVLPKKGLVESTGIGLQNIRTRYRMLNEPGILVQQDETSFAVVIQLIDPARY